jgi:DHA2 family multidrug resistance protein
MAIAALPLRQVRSEAEVYRVRYLIAFAVTLASVLELVDTSIVNVAIPHMMGNLGATLEEVAWVSTGYIVANVIILPLTPWLAARFGRRNYYTGSIILFTVASFFCGNARTLEALVFWRVIQGIGGGALISTAQAILFDVFPLKERGTSTAIFGMGVMVGPALGPTLGGWITDNYSWPWIFYINIPLGMIAAYLTWSYVPEPRYKVQEDAGVDWLGLLFLIMGVGALQILLERGQSKDWFQSTEIVIETGIAAFGMVAFVWHELTAKNPMVNLRVLKRRQLAVGVLFASILGFALYSSVFALPVFLQNYLGFSAWDTGKVLLPGAIATAVTMAVAGKMANKVDVRPVIFFGVVLFALSMRLHSHFTLATGQVDLFWPMILRGIGMGLIFVPLTGLAVAGLPPSDIPQGTGLYNLSRQLGGSFGIAITATILTHFREQSREALRAHVTIYDEATRGWLDQVTQRMLAETGSLVAAQQKAQALLARMIEGQAAVIAFEKVFFIMGAAFLLATPLLLLFKTGRVSGGGGAAH